MSAADRAPRRDDRAAQDGAERCDCGAVLVWAGERRICASTVCPSRRLTQWVAPRGEEPTS